MGRTPDPEKLNALMGRLVGDLGASMTGALILLGDRLGLYKAMADGKPSTAKSLASKTKLNERYVREWLSAQAAAGLVDYDAAKDAFSLGIEQAMALANENSPTFFAGALQIVQSMYLDEPKVAAAFKSGKGVGWHPAHAPFVCSRVPNDSFGHATTPISYHHGFPRLKGWKRS